MNRLLAISDIHGCFDTFYNLVVNRLKLSKSDRLILLGDYIDRGDYSKEVIDFIIDLSATGFNVTPLTGNHEWMLSESLQKDEMLPLWFMNSGLTTMESFAVADIADLEKKYLDFFRNLRYFESEGPFLFVHAGFNDNVDDPFSDKYTMIWECRNEYTNPVFDGKIIIHGHRPKTTDHVRRILSLGHSVIPIDTGCVYEKDRGYGFLSALVVNDMTLVSQERI